MLKPYKLSLHIFRRDLRLVDNTSLIEALKLSHQVIPCFIFDKRQIERNNYKSDNCIQFMVYSLKELDEELHKKHAKLYYFYGIAEDIIGKLIEKIKIDAIFINRDYTPFALTRDHKIEKICQNKNIDFHCFADALLHEPEQVLKANQQAYTIYTPFLKKCSTLPVNSPSKNSFSNYFNSNLPLTDHSIIKKLSQKNNPLILVQGGRIEALTLLKKIKSLKDYSKIRNFPALSGTTHLSAHNKFGTISIREFYHHVVSELGRHHPLISELYWRDFFTHIVFHFPHVLGQAFHEKYATIPWKNNQHDFRTWCEGYTGFPIVDAGMRELNATGYMHNRVRMIVASFLTKDLHIDWRWGEKYFAQKLVDYDPAVNNGNWQWVASTGCDAQPYFRIFNPWLQQAKFDPDCLYIKRWIPELSHATPKEIHTIPKHARRLANYPAPMLDHSKESDKSKKMYIK